MRIKPLLVCIAFGMLAACTTNDSKQLKEDNITKLELTQEWDKTFPLSDKVEHSKVTFHNRFGIELADNIMSSPTQS